MNKILVVLLPMMMAFLIAGALAQDPAEGAPESGDGLQAPPAAADGGVGPAPETGGDGATAMTAAGDPGVGFGLGAAGTGSEGGSEGNEAAPAADGDSTGTASEGEAASSGELDRVYQGANETTDLSGIYHLCDFNTSKHIVALKNLLNGEHLCGGAIISPKAILTAAHCLWLPTEYILVIAGSQKPETTKEYRVVYAIKHMRYKKDFTSNEIGNDIGVIFITKPIDEDGVNIQRIALATAEPMQGDKCTVVGWDRLVPFSSNITSGSETKNVTTPRADCNEVAIAYMDTKTGVCVIDSYGNESIANVGPTGGPLICGDKMVGVVSYGAIENVTLPSVFTAVWKYRDWIADLIKPTAVAGMRSYAERIEVNAPVIGLVVCLAYAF